MAAFALLQCPGSLHNTAAIHSLPKLGGSPFCRGHPLLRISTTLLTSPHRTQHARAARQRNFPVNAVASTQPSTVKIITQGRHVEVTESLKNYVEEKVGKVVAKYESAVKEVDVRVSVAGGDVGKGPKQQKTEITIYTLRNGVVRAEDVEESLYASIDLVSDKIARKLRKIKEKAIARGKWAGPGGPRGGETMREALPTEAEEVVDRLPTDQEAAAFPEVVRTKTFYLQPMTLEDALVQVEQVGHDFYLFRDKETNQVRVLYKRKTRGYGVIVPQLE